MLAQARQIMGQHVVTNQNARPFGESIKGDQCFVQVEVALKEGAFVRIGSPSCNLANFMPSVRRRFDVDREATRLRGVLRAVHAAV